MRNINDFEFVVEVIMTNLNNHVCFKLKFEKNLVDSVFVGLGGVGQAFVAFLMQQKIIQEFINLN